MSDPNEEVINEVLSRAYSREQAHGRPPIYFRTPLDEVLAAESGDSLDEGIIRQEARDRMLEYFFGDGPHPGHVVRRIFAMAKAIKPQNAVCANCRPWKSTMYATASDLLNPKGTRTLTATNW